MERRCIKLNLANKLTMARVMLIPFFVFALLGDFGAAGRYAAAAIFIAASLTDYWDGYIARSRNMVTDFGKFMDALADKLLVASALIAMIELDMMPAWAVIIMVGRELIITGFRLLAAGSGTVIAADVPGKIKAAVQMVMIIYMLAGFGFAAWIDTVLIWLSVLLSLASVAQCIYKNRNILKGVEL